MNSKLKLKKQKPLIINDNPFMDCQTLDVIKPKSFRFRTKAPKIRNITFQGGGGKGLTHIGALQYLEEKNLEGSNKTQQIKVITEIKTVTGSSAGAIMSLLVALGLSSEQVLEKLTTVLTPETATRDGSLIRQALNKIINERLHSFIMGLKKENYNNVSESDKHIIKNIKTILLRKNETITFKHFDCLQRNYPNHFKRLLVSATDLEKRELFVFSSDATPDVSIASAVRASTAFPLRFKEEIISIHGVDRKFFDGGVYDNLPFSAVSDRKYRDDIPTGHKHDIGQNLQTLCLVLGEQMRSKDIFHKTKRPFKLGKQVEYILARMITGMPYGKWNEARWDETKEQQHHRTVFLDPKGTGTLQFKVTDKRKKEMLESGKSAMKEYFEHINEQMVEYEYDSLFELVIGLDEQSMKTLPYHQYNLHVMTFDENDQIRIPKELDNQPILIKKGQHFYIYGCHGENKWGMKRLIIGNNNIIKHFFDYNSFDKSQNPHQVKIETIPQQLYQVIDQYEAHKPYFVKNDRIQESNHETQYQAAMQIRDKLYTNGKPSLQLERLIENLKSIEKGLRSSENINNIQKNISEIMEPLKYIEDKKQKKTFEHAVLNKLNHESNQLLKKTSILLEKHGIEQVPDQDNSLHRFRKNIAYESIFRKTKHLFSHMQIKNTAKHADNIGLIKEIEDSLTKSWLTPKELDATLIKIIEDYQHRTLNLFRKFYKPNTVKRAEALRNELMPHIKKP